MDTVFRRTMVAPAWAETLVQRYGDHEAHAFLLHGPGTLDYAADAAVTVDDYLALQFKSRIVAVYDGLAIRFPFERLGPDGERRSDRRDFIRRVGLDVQADPTPGAQLAGFVPGMPQPSGPMDPEEVELPTAPALVVPLLEQFLLTPPDDETPRAGALVLLNLETYAPDAPWAQLDPGERRTIVRLQQWGRNFAGFDAGGAIVVGMVASLQDLHSFLRTTACRWEQLAVPLPEAKERRAFWRFLIERQEAIVADDFEALPLVPEAGLDLATLAEATAGLRRMNLEDIALRAMSDGMLTREIMRERKRDIVRAEFGDVIELRDPRFGFEAVGGKMALKEWFMRNVIHPLNGGNLWRVPKAVLLPGPAGTGKSFFAEALAYELRRPFLVFNPAMILGRYMGDSEKALEKVLEVIRVAGGIVFIDEIDQSFSRGESGDSGVGRNIFRRILEFMADPDLRGRVVWLSATNRPDLIDAALLSRFEVRIPFVAPDAEERVAIVRVRLAAYGATVGDLNEAEIAAASEGRVGRDLDMVVSRAVAYAQDEAEDAGQDWHETVVETRHIWRALAATRANSRDVAWMTALALEAATEIEMLPPALRQQAQDPEALRQQAEQLGAGRSGRRREL